MNPVPLSTVPPSTASTPKQGGAVNDLVVAQQNQNDGMSAQTNEQPLEQQSRCFRKDEPNNFCCWIAITVLAVIDIIAEAILLHNLCSGYEPRRTFGLRTVNAKQFEDARVIEYDMFLVAEIFFLALAITTSLMLLISNCLKHKILSIVSHVIGWIPLLAGLYHAFSNGTNFETEFSGSGSAILFIVGGLIIGLPLRISESVAVCLCWIAGGSRNRGQVIGQTNYGVGAPRVYPTQPNYGGYGQPGGYAQPGGYVQPGGYAQPGYAQPGGYVQPAGGTGGYNGYPQPGYGQRGGYGGYATPGHV